jgi:integrase
VFVRPGELRGAEWSEIASDQAEWVIPAEKMKMRRAHLVPLSAQAVEILRELIRTIAAQLTPDEMHVIAEFYGAGATAMKKSLVDLIRRVQLGPMRGWKSM